MEQIKEGNVKFLGILPNDDEISKMNLVGENLLNLTKKSKAYTVAKELFSTII